MLPQFKHKQVWTPADALQMKRCMAAFFTSLEGKRASMEYGRQEAEWLSSFDMSNNDEYLNRLRAPENYGMASDRAQFWRDSDPIWVDESFTKMMLAAASSWDGDVIHPEEVISPEGALFFARMIEDDQLPGMGHLKVRALTWQTDLSGQVLIINTWYETNEDRYLWRHQGWNIPLGVPLSSRIDPTIDHHSSFLLVSSLIASVAAISRTSYAVSDRVEVDTQLTKASNRKKQRRKPSTPRKQSIRRIYLSHPDYGDAEYASALPSAPQRLHWVRGHWRRQWYATVEEHRTIWVEGFPRGNRNLGIVEGERVLIAKGVDVKAQDEKKNSVDMKFHAGR